MRRLSKTLLEISPVALICDSRAGVLSVADGHIRAIRAGHHGLNLRADLIRIGAGCGGCVADQTGGAFANPDKTGRGFATGLSRRRQH